MDPYSERYVFCLFKNSSIVSVLHDDRHAVHEYWFDQQCYQSYSIKARHRAVVAHVLHNHNDNLKFTYMYMHGCGRVTALSLSI